MHRSIERYIAGKASGEQKFIQEYRIPENDNQISGREIRVSQIYFKFVRAMNSRDISNSEKWSASVKWSLFICSKSGI